VSGSGDKTIKVWKAHSGELLATLDGLLDYLIPTFRNGLAV
jgi:hypothetical protein